jgi:hypothetical protein
MVSSENNNPSTSARSIECHYRNKYEKWYWLLIKKYQDREQLPEDFEAHHPIPKEIWPLNWRSSSVIWTVGVTFREHFILHLLLVKAGLQSSSSLKRFLEAFARGRNKQGFSTNLMDFWKKFMYKTFIPHNKGKIGLPYVTEDYRKRVGNGGRGKLNNPGLKCKPWENNKASQANKELWKIADYLHYHYQLVPKKKGTSGSCRLAKAVGVPDCQTLHNIVKAFNGDLSSLCLNGKSWDPLDDNDWKSFSAMI